MLQLLQSHEDLASLRVEPGAMRLGAVLEGCTSAAFVVAPSTGTVIAANEAGLERLLLTPDRPAARVTGGLFGITATLPAVRRVLSVETPEGGIEFRCELRLLMADAGQRLILAVELPDETARVGLVEIAAGVPPRNDRETLAEIARRIRDGLGDREQQARAPLPVELPEASKREPPGADPLRAVSTQAKLAHELKTPLSAIVAAAEIMRDERLGPVANDKYRAYAADIHDSARHALELISRLMRGDDAAPADALPPQSFAEIDLNAIAQSAVSALEPMAHKAGLSISAEISERLPHVVADPTSVRQMVLNLATNALKHAGRGARIIVRTSYALAGPVTLAVVDTGRGMSEADAVAAMSGSAAPRAAADTDGSLGLGLPLVKRLAEANGAVLEIDSAPGRGLRAAIVFARDRVVPV